MNQLIEAGLSGLASGLGVAILFGIVWLVIKASHAIFPEPMKEGTSQEPDSKRRTTGVIERPYSTGESKPNSIPRSQAESWPKYEMPKPPEDSSQKNRKIAAGIAILALIFVPTKFCGTYGCSAGGWQFIFDFDYDDQVDVQRMLIQLVVAGIVCWFILRRRDT